MNKSSKDFLAMAVISAQLAYANLDAQGNINESMQYNKNLSELGTYYKKREDDEIESIKTSKKINEDANRFSGNSNIPKKMSNDTILGQQHNPWATGRGSGKDMFGRW